MKTWMELGKRLIFLKTYILHIFDRDVLLEVGYIQFRIQNTYLAFHKIFTIIHKFCDSHSYQIIKSPEFCG